MHNPDPKKYVIRSRNGGQLYLLDKQLLRWRNRRRKMHNTKRFKLEREAAAKALKESGAPPILNPFYSEEK